MSWSDLGRTGSASRRRRSRDTSKAGTPRSEPGEVPPKRQAAYSPAREPGSGFAESILSPESMSWEGVAAALGGSVVGVAGVVFGYLNSKGEREKTVEEAGRPREHERWLARQERLHDEVRESYEDVL